MTKLVQDNLLVRGRVFEEGDPVWPACHSSELPAEIAAILTTLVFVQQEAIFFQLI